MLASLAVVVIASSSEPSFAHDLDLGDSSTLLWLMSALTLCAVARGLWQASRRMHRQDDT